jgi:hypothetical protein
MHALTRQALDRLRDAQSNTCGRCCFAQDYFLEDVIEATNWRPPVGGGGGRAQFPTGGGGAGGAAAAAGGGFVGGSGGRLKVPEGYSEATAQALSATEQDMIDYELVETTLEVQKKRPF